MPGSPTARDLRIPRGRGRATTRERLGAVGLDLFIADGFDGVTVDDIAAAAGIGRRTFFRYFASKNDVPWGDFDALLVTFGKTLRDADPDQPMIEAVRAAVRRFNDIPPGQMVRHRHRMRILLTTPELVAHSTVRYAHWRRVIAEFVADRTGGTPRSALPEAVSWACLGISLGAYEQWIADERGPDLLSIIDAAFRGLRSVFSDIESGGAG